MQLVKVNWGRSIFLGMGPAVYLGFWMPIIIFANPISFEGVAFIFMCCAAISGVYFLASLALLKAHDKWIVPKMKKYSTYDYHCKCAWIYALFLSIPATYMGFFAVAMTYGSPGGHPEFNVISAVALYLSGWLFGGVMGAITGIVILSLFGWLVSK